MPNLKIYLDQTCPAEVRAGLEAALPGLRAMLCARLSVPPSACQLAVIGVMGLPDQPALNIELMLMPGPDRTVEMVRSLAAEMQQLLNKASGRHGAVRIAMLDPASYVALK